MRLFYVEYAGEKAIYNEIGFENFVKVAVLHNKNIHSFRVIEIDNRLTFFEGEKISIASDFHSTYIKEIKKGVTPYKSVILNLLPII